MHRMRPSIAPDQNPNLQLEKPRATDREKVVVERASGALPDRLELNRLLDVVLREGGISSDMEA